MPKKGDNVVFVETEPFCKKEHCSMLNKEKVKSYNENVKKQKLWTVLSCYCQSEDEHDDVDTVVQSTILKITALDNKNYGQKLIEIPVKDISCDELM